MFPRPRVRLLITGDELTHRGRPGPGQVRDALGPLLPSLLAAWDADVVELRHVPDHPTGQLAAAVADGTAAAELTVVTGSTSVGATDQLRHLLRHNELIVPSVACRPGHPQLLAERPGGGWIAGLPGNPYAALVSAYTLIPPLLAGLTGRPLAALPRAPLTSSVPVLPDRTRLVPVVWDTTSVRVVEGHGAAYLRGVALADALAAVPPNWTVGSPVPLIHLAG